MRMLFVPELFYSRYLFTIHTNLSMKKYKEVRSLLLNYTYLEFKEESHEPGNDKGDKHEKNEGHQVHRIFRVDHSPQQL